MEVTLDTSSHICLICNQSIIGLMNYVDHFRSHALPSDVHVIEEKYKETGIHVNSETSSQATSTSISAVNSSTLHQSSTSTNPHNTNVYNPDASPISEFINSPGAFHDPVLDTNALLSPRHCSDFFQSLELKSANEEPAPRPKLKAMQRLSILEDDAHAESLLPITAILSNLDFSSDDDISGIDNLDNDNWLSDEDHSRLHPPQGHTGGKWKPGEGPKRHQPIAGKWRPGQKPGPACRKRTFKKKKSSRYKETGKSFKCNVCNSSFTDRISYSLHFGQSSHKEKAAAKKQDRESTSNLSSTKIPENVEVPLVTENNIGDKHHCSVSGHNYPFKSIYRKK